MADSYTKPNVQRTSNIQFARGVKVLVYGPSGIGKTRLCATAPNPIILSAESGLLSLRKEDIPVIHIMDFNDLRDAYVYLTTDTEGMQYETICLDSISEIAEQALNSEKKVNRDGRAAYGNMADAISALLRSYRDISDRNIYFSCKMDRLQDEATRQILYGPSMPSKNLSSNIPYFFDEVFAYVSYLDPDTNEVKNWLQTKADMQFTAKDRSGALSPLEKPDLTEIFNKIKNS